MAWEYREGIGKGDQETKIKEIVSPMSETEDLATQHGER